MIIEEGEGFAFLPGLRMPIEDAHEVGLQNGECVLLLSPGVDIAGEETVPFPSSPVNLRIASPHFGGKSRDLILRKRRIIWERVRKIKVPAHA